MVTRKPVGGHDQPPIPSTTVTAPTPTSSTADSTPAPSLPSESQGTPPKTDKALPVRPPDPPTDSEDDDEWDKSDSEEEWEMPDKDEDGPKLMPQADIPAPLRISRPPSRASDEQRDGSIPASLRVGPPGGVPQASNESLVSNESNNPWRSVSQTPPKEPSNNPFLRRQNTGEALFGGQNSSAAWAASSSPQPAGSFAELPGVASPVDEMKRLDISELPTERSPTVRQPPALITTEPDSTAAWMEKEKAKLDAMNAVKADSPATADPFGPIPEAGIQSQQVWQQEQPSGQNGKQKAVEPAESSVDRAPPVPVAAPPEPPEESVPALPPRTNTEALEEQAPPKPPRPEVDTSVAAGGSRAGADSPNTAMKKQRNQTYQIKKVRWFDHRCNEMRVSPILTQNLNGPCPLLALVNALTMSTPPEFDTGLVETLRSREQVSLGLLLDAVFEELMSTRRNENDQELPDVSDLYSFLIALHTGMNVNPQFVIDPEQPPTQAGAFEKTREMRLYSTFNVPLMHGWMPEFASEAYAAFDRSAKTYEDAQNIQFYEEELEAKLNGTGLSPEEQNMFEDLVSIKQFFATWPTQLTEHGLKVIKEHMKPGQFGILFRNDHFSTVYKEPRSNAIVTVVTDAGYASHDEIVWESLVDINGTLTEHFSGDFRPVSHSASAEGSSPPSAGPRNGSLSSRPVQSMLDVDQGWSTVQGKKGKRGKSASTGSSSQQSGVIGSSSASAARTQQSSEASGMSKTEQEDADLALALQLQEEEEDRQRREQSNRRNEQLSAQVLEGRPTPAPAQQVRPLIPPRRNNQQNFTTNRPAPASGDDAPPPSYEDASKDRRFNPPRDHPASPHAPVSPNGVSGPSPARQQSAYASNAGSLMGRRPGHPQTLINSIPSGSGRGQRRNSQMSPTGQSREEKCVVM